MKINIKKLLNEALVKLARNLKTDTVDLLQSTQSQSGEYSLYQVDNILAIEHKEELIMNWDEEFEPMYFKYFDQETSRK